MGSILMIQVYALLCCGFWLFHNSFVVKESGFVGIFVKWQEHSGPEPWDKQTVGTIPLLQPTGASYSYKALNFGKKKVQQSSPLRKDTNTLFLFSL